MFLLEIFQQVINRGAQPVGGGNVDIAVDVGLMHPAETELRHFENREKGHHQLREGQPPLEELLKGDAMFNPQQIRDLADSLRYGDSGDGNVMVSICALEMTL